MGNGREKNMYHALALFTAFCGIGIGLEFGIWKLEIGLISKTVPKQFQNSSETGSESSLAQFQIISKIIFRSQPLICLILYI